MKNRQEPIPRGIEVLVKKASVDPAFRTLLLQKRTEAAGEIDLELDAAEAMMLDAVPDAQLEAIIARTSVPQEHRRTFLGKAAAAMLAAIGATAAGQAAAGSGSLIGKGAATGHLADLPPVTVAARIERSVIVVIAKQFGLPPQDVSRETTFAGDLRADPQQRDVLRKDLDEYLNVSIPAEAFENLRTVGEAIDLVAPLVVEARVIEIVAQRVKVAAEQITRDTSLVEDLKVSSTQRVWLRQELLKEYGIHIAWEEFKSLQTVGEVIDSVAKALVKPAAAEPGSQQPELPSPATKGIRPDRIPVTDGARPDL